eukprot:CFRG2894T1
MPNWTNTVTVLAEILPEITCFLCHKIERTPHSLPQCDHHFCLTCITDYYETIDASCPECQIPSWASDFQSNDFIETLVNSYLYLTEIVNGNFTPLLTPQHVSQQEQFSKSVEHACITDEEVDSPLLLASFENENPKNLAYSRPNRTPLSANTARVAEIKNRNTVCGFLGEIVNSSDKNSGKQTTRLSTEAKGNESPVCKVYINKRSTRREEDLNGCTVEDTSLLNLHRRNSTSVVTYSSGLAQATKYKRKRGRESFPPAKRTPLPGSNEHRTQVRAFEKRNPKGETALHRAVIRGNVSTVEKMVQNYLCDPNVKDNADWSPLHEACARGNIEIMRILIQNGADINQRGFQGWTPLHDAIDKNEIEAALFLLENGADPNKLNDDQHKPVYYCDTDTMREAICSFKQADDPPVLSIRSYANTPKIEPTPMNIRPHAGSGNMVGLSSKSTPNSSSYTNAHAHAHKSLHIRNEREEYPYAPTYGPKSNAAATNNIPRPTPRKNNVDTERFILLQTGLDCDKKLMFEKVTKKLHGSVVTKFQPSLTHIVVSTDHQRRCKRTLKYLWAVLNGLHIVSFDWILKSQAANVWLPEDRFLIFGDRSTPNAPDRTTIQMERPLFDGIWFYFHPNINEDLFSPPVRDLVRLVKYGGGSVLTKPCFNGRSEKNRKPVYTICVEDDPELELRPHCTRTVSWLFDCVSFSRILPRGGADAEG